MHHLTRQSYASHHIQCHPPAPGMPGTGVPRGGPPYLAGRECSANVTHHTPSRNQPFRKVEPNFCTTFQKTLKKVI